MQRTFAAALVTTLLCGAASAQTTTLFGQTYRVQRLDYKASIQWPNPVAPFNQHGLIRVEGAWMLPNGHTYVVTSHQDQSVPTTYANFVLEAQFLYDAQSTVTGLQYVRTVVQNDPALLGSPFDLRGGGLAINSTSLGIGNGGNLLVADGGNSDTLRAYDLATGALLPFGPGGVGYDLAPPMTDLTDVTIVTEGDPSTWRIYALDEAALRVWSFTLDGVVDSVFFVGGAANQQADPGDPKGIAFLTDVPTWPTSFQGRGGVVMVSLGDLRSGLQAFTRSGTEIAFEPIDNTVFQTSSPSIQPKIEAAGVEPATGRMYLWMEKGSLVDNWVWVLTPDCNGNAVADPVDLVNGLDHDNDTNGVPDQCEPTGIAFCFGDGSGTSCPCGNSSTVGAGQGCRNSFGAGARLSAVGDASIAFDGLVLNGDLMPNSTALYLQGDTAQAGGAGTFFGDGLRCAGGTVVRLKTVQNVNGSSQYPAASDLPISLRTGIFVPGSYVYQAWYRNAASFCTLSTFNLTNGVEVTWAP